MTVSFEIPPELDRRLREELGNVADAAKEAFAIQLYRDARISAGELGMILGVPSTEAIAWLGKHGIEMNYSLGDLQADRKTLERLLRDDASQ